MSGTVDVDAPPLSLVSRAEWEAMPPTVELADMNTPCIMVRLWRFSDVPSCTTKEECIKIVREMQRKDIDEGFGDIRYNFMVGYDGNAYEGRGYRKAPWEDSFMSEISGRYLEIAFIGDHRGLRQTHRMYNIVYLLVEKAVENGHVKLEAFLRLEE